jgi:hypothetical protein
MTRYDLREKLADAEHASWARWMVYLFSKCQRQADGSCTIPPEYVSHWQREVETPYEELSEREKESDRAEVELILPIIDNYAACQSGGEARP